MVHCCCNRTQDFPKAMTSSSLFSSPLANLHNYRGNRWTHSLTIMYPNMETCFLFSSFFIFSLFKFHSVTIQAPPSPHTPAVQSLDMFHFSAGKNKLAKHVDDVWDLWLGFKLPQTYSVTHVITPTQVFACSSVRSHALESCRCRSHWELVLLLPDGVCNVCVCDYCFGVGFFFSFFFFDLCRWSVPLCIRVGD